MSYTFPPIVETNDDFAKAFEYEELITSTGIGDWVIFPTIVRGAFVELETSTGSGYIETTLDPMHYVYNNIAVAKVWASGTVSSTLTREYFNPVTAIRAINVSGDMRLKIRFQ
jgi:hypothetical protein